MPTKRDFYEVLGISKSATPAQIKAAYKKMALKWHPDRNQANKAEAETKFKEINEAYQVLSDEQKKKSYDQFGHAAFDPASGMGGMGGNPFAGGFKQGPFTWSYSTSSGGGQGANFDFGDPFEIFEQFFGGGFAGRTAQRPRYSLSVEFMEAIKGTEKQVSIDGKPKKIKIPAGANDGTRIRFEDFDITINVKPHPQFKRDGQDLYVDAKLPFTIAALGGEIAVPTINGELKMKVRAGTQSHTLVRLRGEGAPHIQGRGQGDLYVRLLVEVPERLSREQKRLLEEFGREE